MEKGSLDETRDWYFHNGLVWDETYSGFFPGEVLVRDGRIEEMVFKESLPARSHTGAEDIDLECGYLCPGLIDSHMHLLQWSITRNGLDLSNCKSKKDIEKAVRCVLDLGSSDKIFENQGIIFGRDYDDSHFKDGPLNDGSFLEKEFPDIPILLRRVCGHKALANAEGFGMIGLVGEVPSNGLVLEENAMTAPWKLPLNEKTLSEFLSDGIDHLYSKGIVGGVDIIPSSQMERMGSALMNINKEIFLTISIIRDCKIRSTGKIPPESWYWFDDNYLPVEKGIRSVFEKFFLDGSIGSRTASFSEDYTDLERAPLIMDDITLKKAVEQSYEDGLIPMIHCIGDRAVSQGIRAMEKLDMVYRLEHAEAINEAHLKKMSRTKGALCLQPNFQKTWGEKGGLYEKTLGGRYLSFNPFRSIVDSSILWCFGTDMMPLDPLYSIKGAVEHPNIGQRLKIEEALMGFTQRSRGLSFILNDEMENFSIGSEANIITVNREFLGINSTFLKGKNVYLHHN